MDLSEGPGVAAATREDSAAGPVADTAPELATLVLAPRPECDTGTEDKAAAAAECAVAVEGPAILALDEPAVVAAGKEFALVVAP
jgi:hypothetical protein